MNLHSMLAARAEAGSPVRVGLVGAGKFGTMFLAQARITVGMHVVGIADLDPQRAKTRLAGAGWSAEQLDAASPADAVGCGRTWVGDDADALIAADGLEVLIEATGDPAGAIQRCLDAFRHGRHVVMVSVEADVVAGPWLAREARRAGVVYSLAWGDQPALICDHVDWARACGFEVVCAGKGTRYLPSFHQSTPDTVWEHYHFGREVAERAGANPKMFNSFIDGSKSAIEMSAVCNATGLTPQPDGLGFPPCSRFDLASVCKPQRDGGRVSHAGTTEVVSSLRRDGGRVEHDLMLGTYVVIKTDNDYVRHCFEEYIMLPDDSFRYAALYRPIHMIGLELGISVAAAALRKEPTGAPLAFNADVVAVAKRDLRAGQMLDGEGGYCVWGKQMPAADSLELGGLPLGLAHQVALTADVAAGQPLRWSDVVIDADDPAVRARRAMEKDFG